MNPLLNLQLKRHPLLFLYAFFIVGVAAYAYVSHRVSFEYAAGLVFVALGSPSLIGMKPKNERVVKDTVVPKISTEDADTDPPPRGEDPS